MLAPLFLFFASATCVCAHVSTALRPAQASDEFCAPAFQAPSLLPPAPAPTGGPKAAQAALRPYLRPCQYFHLPPPHETTLLELCLLKSARIILKDNFSIFVGYFLRWDESGGAAAHQYTGGSAWSCSRERSLTLRVECSGIGLVPTITQWWDDGECRYEAHLLLPGSC